MDYLIDLLLNFYGPYPYLIILGILLACGLGVPIPEDITLFAAGVMAYYGISNLWLMIAISMFGVLVGDSIIFLLGAKYGRGLTKKGFFKRVLPEDRLDTVAEYLNRRGTRFIFIARFMPGLRAPIFFTAGTLGVPFRVFFFYDGLAALLSVPAIIGAVYYFGDQLDQVVRVIQRIEHGIVFAVGLAVLALVTKWYLGQRNAQRS